MKISLSNILNKILLSEGADYGSVLDSIRNKYYVRIRYDDEMEGKGFGDPKGSRVIQPMAIGSTKAGNPVLRAFQMSGNSRRGAPKWKYFRLDRIKSWFPMKNKHFYTIPDEKYGRYNREGDNLMGAFDDNAKFDDMEDPLNQVRAARMANKEMPKVSTKNVSGPIAATQQRKKNVFTSQPNSTRYADIAKAVNQSSFTPSKWADYEKAQQEMQPNKSIYDDDEDDYDIDDAELNDYFKYRNNF